MKVIILAAGMGTRLEKYTKNLPKCMLRFKGKPLIQWQVETLRACGLKDITIVKGYMPEKIKLRGVKTYINPDFAGTNMVETLFCAEKEMTDEILVVYSDILYEKKLILNALKSKADIGVTVDNDYWAYWQSRLDHPEEDTESMVIDKTGKIIDLGDTHCKKSEAQVRYVGMIRFSKKGVKALKKVYHAQKAKYFDNPGPWLRSKSFKKAYMTCMLHALINADYRVDPIFMTHGWMEFDTVEDYEKANQWDKEGSLKRFINL